MIIKHKELVDKGRKILLEKGFKESEIMEEETIKLSDGSLKVVDIVGTNKKMKVGIECGGLTKNMEIIKKEFDEFILIPYVGRSGNKFHCSNCDHQWVSRVEIPRACPGCKRYFHL